MSYGDGFGYGNGFTGGAGFGGYGSVMEPGASVWLCKFYFLKFFKCKLFTNRIILLYLEFFIRLVLMRLLNRRRSFDDLRQ